ncbi:hypothetical protein F7725_022364 [Dissostichus mawsoni]|uniref:Uncharacterized protein n=1 Tax=Dissostichus mawsoni TaxID=36200 RepID=A0A7J5YZU2_DISMA|nr:hypothetical protein F7725_022364 [Dissostichus mawsoni]
MKWVIERVGYWPFNYARLNLAEWFLKLNIQTQRNQQSQKKVGVQNIYVKHTLKVWSAVQKRFRGTVALSRAIQIVGNLEFLPSIADSTFKKWADRGLKIIDQLFYDNILQPFSYLQETFQLPSCDMFRLGITLQHIEIGT